MQGVAGTLPLLHRPEHQRAIKALGIDPSIAEPTAAATLSAGRQAAVQRNGSLPLVKTDGLAVQPASDHPAEQHQMALVADRAVLTQEAGELSMEPGVGIHEGLVWCRNPNLSWLPAHPMGRDPFCCNGSPICVRQSGLCLRSAGGWGPTLVLRAGRPAAARWLVVQRTSQLPRCLPEQQQPPDNDNTNNGLRPCCPSPPAPFTVRAAGRDSSGSARRVQTRSGDHRPAGESAQVPPTTPGAQRKIGQRPW